MISTMSDTEYNERVSEAAWLLGERAPIFSFSRGRNGNWLVSGPAGHQGQDVRVQRKNGQQARINLGRVLWTDGERSLYAI